MPPDNGGIGVANPDGPLFFSAKIKQFPFNWRISSNAAAEQAKTQLLAALKASEFISQERLDSWLASLSLPNDKQAAIVDAVDELDYEAAIAELENS